MKISEILGKDAVVWSLAATDKAAVLKELAEHLAHLLHPSPASVDTIYTALLTRESLGSTGVGEGVAIPHAKLRGLTRLTGCFGRAVGGIAFDAIDFKPVRLIFVLLVPEDSAGTHLKALAKVSRLLKNAHFREGLLTSGSQAALYQAFLDEDARI